MSVNRHVVGAGVAAGGEFLSLQEHVVEETRSAEPEQVRLEPLLPDGLGDGDEVLDRVLGAADAASGLHPDLLAGEDWLDPGWFRFGASTLLNDLLMQRSKLSTGHYSGPDYVTLD